MLEIVVARGGAVLIQVGARGERALLGNQGFEQGLGLASGEQRLSTVDVSLEARTSVGRGQVGLVVEARRGDGNRAPHVWVACNGKEVDGFDRAQAVAPQGYAAESARRGEVEPRAEIVATVVDHLVGGAETALLQLIGLVVATIVNS